jgi:4-diphosphocytidyl-2-C-methyl-D-erythritol kinase
MTLATGECERLAAPAKLNLCLQITGRRADGYHLVDSVVVFTDFGDSLTVRPAGGNGGTDSLDITGPFAAAIADDAENICLRAIRRYRDAGGMIGPLSVTLDKHIPVGAGLGGGSSNAAAILRYLDRHAATRIDPDAMRGLALDLGADVPVCLAGVARHMTGIGEQLRPLDSVPHGHVVLARPEASLSTIAVFREFARTRPGVGMPRDLPPPPADPARIMRRGNDLAEAARHLCPDIGDVMDLLAECEGAEGVQMSGSGSACFALFQDARLASAAAGHLTMQGQWAVATAF